MEDNEYRMVCAHFGDDGHQLHNYIKRSEKSAVQGAIDGNHAADINPDGFYNKKCTPYVAQFRPNVEWGDLT